MFDRAVAAVGLDWRHGAPWENYLEFVEAFCEWALHGQLCRKVMAGPMEAVALVEHVSAP